MIFEDCMELIVDKGLKKYLEKCNFGLEKENVRVNKHGELAKTLHPKGLGDKDKNPYIQRDFAESQVEMITPVFDTLEEVYNFMENLNRIVTIELEGKEFLWPQSNPPVLPNEDEIMIAQFKDEKNNKYREELAKKYGKKRQVITGVHYNFSFKEELIKILYENMKMDESYREFKDKIYFKVARNFLRYSWIAVYLTGASPVFHKTYMGCCALSAEQINKEDYIFQDMLSLRNSKCGYKNKVNYYVSYNNQREYVESLQGLVRDGYLSSAKEYYNPIRVKTLGEGDTLTNLINKGVDYLEVRMLDLDPKEPIGVSLDSLYLIHAFLVYMLLKEDEKMDEISQREAYINKEIISIRGGEDTCKIFVDGEKIDAKEKAIEVLKNILDCMERVFGRDEKITNVVKENLFLLIENREVKGKVILNEIKESSFIEYHMNLAREYESMAKGNGYTLKGYEDLELSTQILILEAIKKGIRYKVIDRKENFISLEKDGNIEYVKQATKTSLDSYITALIMENKLVSKELLAKANVRVPLGKDYDNAEEAKDDYEYFSSKQIVIKPKSTNFGIGITIFKEEFSREEFNRGIEIAFSEDNSILIEEFIKGKEYRFLIIGDEVAGILHRVPANVVGDGKSTIEELVNEKNKDPLRGKGYKTPLEKISLGEAEKMFLKQVNKDFNYVPSDREIVYLRENSNISTGGDSIDFTDDIHDSYKKIAMEAAKAVGAVITGVDVMIEDIKEEASYNNHGIIEVNFNPAIHIHSFPYRGENRRVAEKILNLLFK